MTDPNIPQSVKDSYWQKAANDPLFASSNIESRSAKNSLKMTDLEVSSLLREIRMDIDPDANKPTILTTPIEYRPISGLYTPNDSDKILQWSQIPGLMPEIRDFGTQKESFPDQTQDLDDFDMSVLLKDYGHFPTKVEWTSPSGTKQTYKVYQRDDIDWDLVRISGDKRFVGKTNREAALSGVAPQLTDGYSINLHHLAQDSRGGLVEASGEIHKKYNKVLHSQHGFRQKHPEFPVDHGSKWLSDVKEYWKWRAQNER